MKRLLMMMTLLFMLSACEKKVTFPLPQGTSQTVLNALMNEDSIIYARMTQLNRDLSTSIIEQEAKEMSLYENGVFKENLYTVKRNGLTFYRSNIRAVRGNRYRIVAKISDGALEGEDLIPGIADISATDLSHEPNDEGGEQTKLRFSLSDKAGVSNYYRFRVFEFDASTNNYTQVSFTVDGKTEVGSDLTINEDYTSFFTEDALFDGRDMPYTLSLRYAAIDSAIVEITTLTETSYKYLKSSYQTIENAGNPFTEAGPVFSNIKNGLGIIGGIAVNKVLIK